MNGDNLGGPLLRLSFLVGIFKRVAVVFRGRGLWSDGEICGSYEGWAWVEFCAAKGM